MAQWVDEDGTVRLEGTLIGGGGVPSGNGPPLGVITPTSTGVLYVDASVPALWQATGATSADWTIIAVGTQGATLDVNINVAPQAGPSLGASNDLRLEANGNQLGGDVGTVTTLSMTITSGAGKGISAIVQTPPFHGTVVVATAIISVSNAAGTERLALQLAGGFNITTPGIHYIDWRGSTVLEQIGADLAINATNGRSIDSTAGGQYAGSLLIFLTGSGLYWS